MSEDQDPDSSNRTNGPSTNDIEQRTWDWFTGAVALRFGPAYYQLLGPTNGDRWPDVVALRAHDRVAFEITSPLRPEDVVHKLRRNGVGVESDDHQPAQARLERRVVEALKRKIRRYQSRAQGMPLCLLITLAHPSALPLTAQLNLKRLSGVVRGHLANFLDQPLDAVYLVGPGTRAHLLWRRRGPKWKKIFPDLDAAPPVPPGN